jgi:hypothetical protein
VSSTITITITITINAKCQLYSRTSISRPFKQAPFTSHLPVLSAALQI